MNILERWASLSNECGGYLPTTLKPFQVETQTLLEAGRHVLVAVPTGQGKSLIQLTGSRLMGGRIPYILLDPVN